MIQIQQVLGLPVLLRSGRRIGRVKDIRFDEFWSLSGIVLDHRVWLRKAYKVVSWDDVVSCGPDAIFVNDNAEIAIVDKKRLFRTYHTGIIQLKDMPVFTKEGLRLGDITDVYFKETAGRQIIGYELTDGFLADVMEGRRRLFLPEQPENVTIGENAIIVPSSYERVLERDHTWKVTGEDG
ncbi:PRC-barrel domain-containing protein [Cohnella yongneupensis]|uniref:PRC-barrel domain-containing protein n=1 Tax=Cohnella yongneupensis TaxID=425006 RepID=A0ABW0R452_9BACL